MWDSIRSAGFPARSTVQASDGRHSIVLQSSSAPVLQSSSAPAVQRRSKHQVSEQCLSVRPSNVISVIVWDRSGRGLLQDNVIFVSMG
jgi:hypothetical protein